MNKHFICSILVLLMLFGCNSTDSVSDNTKTSETVSNGSTDTQEVEQQEILGIGLTEVLSDREFYDPIPFPNYYYGQLLIDTSIFKKAIEGPNAKKLMNYIYQIFGSERKQFGISVVPKLNGVVLPEFVVFSYIYDSESNKWSTDLTRKYRSPIVPLNDLSSLNFKLKFVASNEKDVSIVNSLSSIATTVGGVSPGTWVISETSKNKVKEAVSAVDDLISSVLSNSIEANVNNQLEPVSDGSKALVYNISTTDNEKLAEVKFSTRLLSSLVSGRIVSEDSMPSDFQSAIPTVDPFTNPLNRIKISGNNETTLNDQLKSDGILRNLVNANDVNTFKQHCRDLLDQLSSQHGLNIFDSLNAMRNALTLTRFVKDSGLYNSGCITSSEFLMLEKMGVPLNYEKPVMTTRLNNEILKKLAGYFKSPIANVGFENDILNLFDESLVKVASGAAANLPFTDEISMLDRQNLLGKFKFMKAATTCCWGGNVIKSDGTPNELAKKIYFRTLMSQALYSIELYQEGENQPVDFVRIKEVKESDIPINWHKILLQPAQQNVEGFQYDVVIVATNN